MPTIDKDIYSIHAVRLVNFHNIDCVTVPVAQGGHLFLLGDNGSGKTTILDAIHYVLSAGELELNSAARFGGNKQNGRRIHGVVTAYNVDYDGGDRFPDGRVTYAALELRNRNGGIVSVGIGLSIAGTGAALQQWGFTLDMPVNEAPLLVAGPDGAEYPPDREEFKKAVQKCGGRYYTSMQTYARAVTSRFFPTESQYQDYRSFLNMCKAYREMSSRAGNYHELFKSLLPEPEAETIRSLRLSMRTLRDSHSTLSALEKKSHYLDELYERQKGIGRAAEAIEDLETGVLLFEEKEQRRSRERVQSAIAGMDERLNELGAEAARALEAEQAVEKNIHDLKERDAGSLVASEKNRTREYERLSGRAAELDRTADALEARMKHLRGKRTTVFESFLNNSSAFSGKLAENLTQWRTLPLREAMDEFNTAMEQDKPYRKLPEAQLEKLLRAVAGEEERVKAGLEACRVRADDAKKAKLEREAELEALMSTEEACPENVPDYRELLAELDSRFFDASPLYLKLHWRDGISAPLRGAVEELIGEPALSTIVAAADCADEVKTLLLADYPGARCARKFDDAKAPSPAIREFLNRYFDAGKNAAFLEVLAREMDGIDMPKFDPSPEPKFVEWRGTFRTLLGQDAVLIGEEERRQEQKRRVSDARELLKAAAESAANAAAAVTETEKRQKSLHRFQERLNELCSLMRGDSRELAALDRELDENNEKITRNRAEYTEVENTRSELLEHLDRLRRQIKEQNLEELEQQIAEQELRLKSAQAECDRLKVEQIKLQTRREQQTETLDSITGKLAAVEAELNRRLEHNPRHKSSAALAEALADSGTASLDECHRKIAAERDRVATCREFIRTKINDPEGIDYSFSYDEEQNELYSREHRTLKYLLDHLQANLAEQKEILNQETRRKFEDILLVQFRESLRRRIYALEGMCTRINSLLKGHVFGSNTYSLRVTPQSEYAPLVKLLRGFTDQDIEHSGELKEIFDANMESILETPSNQIPPILDYRNYYRYEMILHAESRSGRVMDTRAKSVGSGGEQAVPNYLLVMMIAHLLFEKAEGTATRIRINSILFDEAFYGIDTARRDQLLGFAEELGLQLAVASPDQDGIKPELSNSTNIFVRKDREFQVHLFPYNWKRSKELFDDGANDGLGTELA
jgi:energy-coupling factor transporter ATP-binding protein EcfA2